MKQVYIKGIKWYKISIQENEIWRFLSQYCGIIQGIRQQGWKKETLTSFMFIYCVLAVIFKWKIVICPETHNLAMWIPKPWSVFIWLTSTEA